MPTRSGQRRVELLQGTRDLLILPTLRWGSAHGHAIAKAIEHGSDDVLLVEQRAAAVGRILRPATQEK
jgi:hypothetical protein